MTDVNYPVKGRCQCGSVNFTLKAAPKVVIACHCKECQKLSTSAFSITCVVDAKDIAIQGELKQTSRTADSGNDNIGHFCSGCGNRIYQLNPAAPDMIKFKAAASLDDTRMIVPTMHVWTSEKQDWVVIPDDVQQFEKQR
ncbi:GFA family protein [Vibrio sp.]|uniref:GFA family protein n=1 Tax=Vibrio sp. TaxID=678 RepID=UPI003AA98F69